MGHSLILITNVTGHLSSGKLLLSQKSLEYMDKKLRSAMTLFLMIVNSGLTINILFLIIVILYLTV